MFTVRSTAEQPLQRPDGSLISNATLVFTPRPMEFVTEGGGYSIETAEAAVIDGIFSKDLEWVEGLSYAVSLKGSWGFKKRSFVVPADGETKTLGQLMPMPAPSPSSTFVKGDSAYEVAVADGFVGTEAEWLESLRGAKGDAGDAGDEGLSAYQVAVTEGFAGSEAAWLESLVGQPGPAGPNAPQPGGYMGPSIEGTFTVTQPSAPGMTTGFYALAMDPAVGGRVWGNGRDFSTFGYYEPATNTYVAKTLHPGTGGMHELRFTTAHAWLLTGANASQDGQLWRSPLPDASGNGLLWTKVLDLAAMPPGLTSGVNSCFRPQCFAVAPNGGSWHVGVGEYSISAAVVGGPSFYYSANAGSTWTKPKTWANAKHVHSVLFVDGVWWAMLGDATFTDLGLWRSTSAAATVWSRISKYGEGEGGNTYYGIGGVPIPLNGNPVWAFEGDSDLNVGMLVFPYKASVPGNKWSFRPMWFLPPGYPGSLRSVTVDLNGNIVVVVTTEDGSLGQQDDTVWGSRANEHTVPILYGSLGPPSSRPYGRAVLEPLTGAAWFGDKRCFLPRFVGQPTLP